MRWDIPTNAGEFPVDARDIPTNAGEFPVDARDIPTNAGEFPVDARDIPADAREFRAGSIVGRCRQVLQGCWGVFTLTRPDEGTTVRHGISAAGAFFSSASVNGQVRHVALTPFVSPDKGTLYRSPSQSS